MGNKRMLLVTALVSGLCWLFTLTANAQEWQSNWPPPERGKTVKAVNLTGKWKGSWTSHVYLTKGNIYMTLKQTGSKVSGKMSITNTDCGTISNIKITGQLAYKGRGVKLNASAQCNGHVGALKYTVAVIENPNWLDGLFTIILDRTYTYDDGVFTISRVR